VGRNAAVLADWKRRNKQIVERVEGKKLKKGERAPSAARKEWTKMTVRERIAGKSEGNRAQARKLQGLLDLRKRSNQEERGGRTNRLLQHDAACMSFQSKLTKGKKK